MENKNVKNNQKVKHDFDSKDKKTGRYYEDIYYDALQLWIDKNFPQYSNNYEMKTGGISKSEMSEKQWSEYEDLGKMMKSRSYWVLDSIKDEFRTGGVAGSKHVSVTKGYRLPHGYEAVKGDDKDRVYSKGRSKVKVDKGWRLTKGYEVVEGAYDMKYDTGGDVDKIQFYGFDSETMNDDYYVEKTEDGKYRVYFQTKYWVLDREGNNTWEGDSFVGYADFDNVQDIDSIKNEILKDSIDTQNYNRAIGHRTKLTHIDVISKDDHDDYLREVEEERMERDERNRRRGRDWDEDEDEYRTGGVAGSKHVDVTKGYRLTHGYKAIKGTDKNFNYSKGHPKVKVTPGYRLPHGYEVEEGAYNIKYKEGGEIDLMEDDLGVRLMSRGGLFGQNAIVTDIEEEFGSDELKAELKKKMKKDDVVIAFAYTDYGGDFFDKVLIEYFEENYPKNIVVENSGWNGQNAFVFGEPAKEYAEATENYPLGFEDTESFYYERQYEEEQEGLERFIDEDLERKYTFDKQEVLSALLDKYSGYWNVLTSGLDYSYSDMIDYLMEKGLIKEEAAKGKNVKKETLLSKIKSAKAISENEINLIKNRMNRGKGSLDAETQEALDYINETNIKLTPEQNTKGIKFLMNLYKSPTGKVRTNNPFGEREISALNTFKHFELAGFNDIGNSYFNNYVPVYIVVGTKGTFEYYYDGRVNIIGEKGMQYRSGGVAGSKHVSVTKGYRLPHGYQAVKGSDKNKNYSKGYKGVRVDAGWRLPHGYEVTEGAYNMKYAKGSNVNRQNYNNLIGEKNGEYYFLESIFKHTDGLQGATGVTLVPVNKSYYEYATSYDGVIERFADAMSEKEWAEQLGIDYEEALEDGTLDEQINDGIWQTYQYGDLQVFEEADTEQEQQLRDIGLSSEEYPVIEVVGAGRIFSNKNNFDKVFDKNLLAKIEEIEKQEMRTGGVAGSKHVSVTKGYRLPHGYQAVKGADKNYNYSKGHPRVNVDKGWRLPKGYEVVEGAYNMKYDTGGNFETFLEQADDNWYDNVWFYEMYKNNKFLFQVENQAGDFILEPTEMTIDEIEDYIVTSLKEGERAIYSAHESIERSMNGEFVLHWGDGAHGGTSKRKPNHIHDTVIDGIRSDVQDYSKELPVSIPQSVSEEMSKSSQLTESQYHRAVNHFVYFCMNYPSNFMDAFGNMKEHLQSKFNYAYEKYGSVGAMIKFYTELDSENQKALLTWAMNNYKGTKLAEGGLMETDMLTSFDIMAKGKNVEDKSNYVIFKGNRCHCSTTQNKGYQDAVNTAKNQQCHDGLIIKGEMIWNNGRVKGIRLADGREMMYGEYEREFFTEPQMQELIKISKRK